MLTIAGLLGGAGWGVWLAKKRGGSKFDLAQYGVGFGILWGLIGLLVSIFLARA